MAQSRKDGVRQLMLTRRKGGWTRRQIEAFFEHLAATCNVAASAAAARIDATAAYRWRRRDPVFARLWEQALDEGADRLEMLAMARALRAASEDAPGADDDGRESGGGSGAAGAEGVPSAGEARVDAGVGGGSVGDERCRPALADNPSAKGRKVRMQVGANKQAAGRGVPSAKRGGIVGRQAAGDAGDKIDLTQAMKIAAAREARVGRTGRETPVAMMPADELERALLRRLAAVEKRLAARA
jgi:hypothetical protein